MRKFLAVVRHEYRKIVLKWSFLIGTFLLPTIAALFAIVPALIFSMQGEPIRVAVADNSGFLKDRIVANLSANAQAEKIAERAADAMGDVPLNTASQPNAMKNVTQQFLIVETPKASGDERAELNRMIAEGAFDAFLIIPADPLAADARFEFVSRKAGDLVSTDAVRDAINTAVRSERLSRSQIDERAIDQANRRVKFESRSIDADGQEKSSGALLAASFIIGLMIYITLSIYGQVIMSTVVEEKETRLAEILFSSARPFQLMMGKLVGVGLAGLTQLGIWITSLAVIAGVAAMQSGIMTQIGELPSISPLMVLYFLVFFILGYFIYASIFALIGSIVTTVQEGGQFSFPAVMLMLIGFYLGFAVIRDPNSTLAFWASIAPFFAPLTMPIRIIADTPPFWQIALAVAINAVTIAFLVWLASRVYRVGMLMYGKRASIPEVFKWIRQA